jgi:thiamine transport system ATP-binding protein
MEGGRVAQSGTPADVWDHPATPFVAGFLGWNVTRAFGDGLVAVRPEGLRLTASSARVAVVTGRTFRRDHYLLEIEVGDGERLEVAVALDDPVPEVGDTVGYEVVPGAAVALA